MFKQHTTTDLKHTEPSVPEYCACGGEINTFAECEECGKFH
jgi:hypothetical protein